MGQSMDQRLWTIDYGPRIWPVLYRDWWWYSHKLLRWVMIKLVRFWRRYRRDWNKLRNIKSKILFLGNFGPRIVVNIAIGKFNSGSYNFRIVKFSALTLVVFRLNYCHLHQWIKLQNPRVLYRFFGLLVPTHLPNASKQHFRDHNFWYNKLNHPTIAVSLIQRHIPQRLQNCGDFRCTARWPT